MRGLQRQIALETGEIVTNTMTDEEFEKILSFMKLSEDLKGATNINIDDIAELEHWIEIAVRDGLAKAQEVAAEKMKPLMGGLGNLGL